MKRVEIRKALITFRKISMVPINSLSLWTDPHQNTQHTKLTQAATINAASTLVPCLLADKTRMMDY